MIHPRKPICMLTPLKSLYAFIILFLNLVMILCSRSRSHPHLAQKMCHIGNCSLPQKCPIKLMAVARLTVFILEIDTLIPQSITKYPPQLIVKPAKLDSPMHTFLKLFNVFWIPFQSSSTMRWSTQTSNMS